MFIEECLTSRDVISLGHFRELSAPYARELVSECRRLGLKAVYYFCGDASDRLEDLVAMRPDAISRWRRARRGSGTT